MINRIQKKKNNDETPKKLFLLISILPHNKRSLLMDIIEEFEVNYHISLFGRGVADEKVKEMLGLNDNHRDILLSIIREDKVKDCIAKVEDKLTTLKAGGIAFAIPFESIIGVKNYLFCANLGGLKNGK